MINSTKVHIPSQDDLSILMREEQSKIQYKMGFNDAVRKGNDDILINIYSEDDIPYLCGYICGMGTMENTETGARFLFPDLNCEDFDVVGR